MGVVHSKAFVLKRALAEVHFNVIMKTIYFLKV